MYVYNLFVDIEKYTKFQKFENSYVSLIVE